VGELLDAQPDLISLQEIWFPMRQGEWLRNQLNARLATRGEVPYTLALKRKAHPVLGSLEGIGVLSRLPLVSQDAISLGYGGRVALRIAVELENGRMLDFIAVHLHHLSYDREARLEQVMSLVSWLSGPGRAPFRVVAGDFNEVPAGPAIKYMKQTFISAFEAARGSEPLATYPTALVKPTDDWTGCIDYIFLSSGMIARSARIFCNKPAPDDSTLYPSDHVGIVATLQVSA